MHIGDNSTKPKGRPRNQQLHFVAELFDVSPDCIRKWLYKGKLAGLDFESVREAFITIVLIPYVKQRFGSIKEFINIPDKATIVRNCLKDASNTSANSE